MKKYIILTLFIFGMHQAFGCKPKLVMSIKHTPCFGKCPDYELQIYSNGLVYYDGGRFSARLGKMHKKITKKEVKDLVEKFNNAKFFEFNDKYTAQVTDMPTTYISFYDHGKSKTITDYYDAPPALRHLEMLLNAYADNDEGWILEKDSAPKK